MKTNPVAPVAPSTAIFIVREEALGNESVLSSWRFHSFGRKSRDDAEIPQPPEDVAATHPARQKEERCAGGNHDQEEASRDQPDLSGL